MSGPKRRSPVVQFLAWLLMAAGVLIFTTAGACSLFFIFAVIAPGGSAYFGDAGGVTLLVLTFGGVPFLVGLALFFGGLRLSRPSGTRTPARATERDDEPTTGA